MKVQAVHATLRILLLMTCLVVGQFGRFGVNLHAIQLLLPTLHQNLDFLLGLLSLGVELRDSCVLQFGTNIRKESDPVFSRSIVRIRIENNANLVLSLFEELVQPSSTQCIDQALAGLGMQIKVDRNGSQECLILKQTFLFLFQSFDVQAGQPFLAIDCPCIWSFWLSHQMTDNTRSIACTALFVKSTLEFSPHTFSRTTTHGCLMRMFLVVDLPQTVHILVFELHSLVLKTDNLQSKTDTVHHVAVRTPRRNPQVS